MTRNAPRTPEPESQRVWTARAACRLTSLARSFVSRTGDGFQGKQPLLSAVSRACRSSWRKVVHTIEDRRSGRDHSPWRPDKTWLIATSPRWLGHRRRLLPCPPLSMLCPPPSLCSCWQFCYCTFEVKRPTRNGKPYISTFKC